MPLVGHFLVSLYRISAVISEITAPVKLTNSFIKSSIGLAAPFFYTRVLSTLYLYYIIALRYCQDFSKNYFNYFFIDIGAAEVYNIHTALKLGLVRLCLLYVPPYRGLLLCHREPSVLTLLCELVVKLGHCLFK